MFLSPSVTPLRPGGCLSVPTRSPFPGTDRAHADWLRTWAVVGYNAFAHRIVFRWKTIFHVNNEEATLIIAIFLPMPVLKASISLSANLAPAACTKSPYEVASNDRVVI